MDVRIEHLNPMRVAMCSAGEPDAEITALEAVLTWAQAHDFLADHYRLFGYDNCLPGPQHLYTAWVTVGSEARPDGGVEILDFPGGLYARLRVTGVDNIKSGWDNLARWLQQSPYRLGPHPSLEEHLDPPDTPLDQLTLDLWLSLAA